MGVCGGTLIESPRWFPCLGVAAPLGGVAVSVSLPADELSPRCWRAPRCLRRGLMLASLAFAFVMLCADAGCPCGHVGTCVAARLSPPLTLC